MLKPEDIEPAKNLAIGLYRILSGVVGIINQGWVIHPSIPKTGLEPSYDEYDRTIKYMVDHDDLDLTEFMLK